MPVTTIEGNSTPVAAPAWASVMAVGSCADGADCARAELLASKAAMVVNGQAGGTPGRAPRGAGVKWVAWLDGN